MEVRDTTINSTASVSPPKTGGKLSRSFVICSHSLKHHTFKIVDARNRALKPNNQFQLVPYTHVFKIRQVHLNHYCRKMVNVEWC